MQSRPDDEPHREREADGGLPRWVRTAGIVVAIVVLLVVVLLVATNGPGGHQPPVVH